MERLQPFSITPIGVIKLEICAFLKLEKLEIMARLVTLTCAEDGGVGYPPGTVAIRPIFLRSAGLTATQTKHDTQ